MPCAAKPQRAPRTIDALWMVLGAFLFATMGVCVKFASATFNAFELVAYRGLFGIAFLLVLARWRGVRLHTTVPGMHVWRSVVGVISVLAWFYAIGLLPLATAMTLNYMSSVWVGTFVLASLLLMPGAKNHTSSSSRRAAWRQGPLFATIVLGFAGVAMVLQPVFAEQQALGGLAGLGSGLFAALAYLQVAALARAGEPETRTVFYFSLGALITGLVGMAFTGTASLWQPNALWLIPMGLFAVLGQLCMTRAYSSGATLVVANLQYFAIVFAALYSMWVFNDQLGVWGWGGMALITFSGIAATILRQRTVSPLPAEEHS
jgi:S-adenosylmethionine uptake transporter